MNDRLLSLLQGGILQPFPIMTSGMIAKIILAVDILLVTALLTTFFRFLRRTGATNILWGLVLVGGGIVVARMFNLVTMNLVLTIFFALLVFALPILFQPELRRGLERLGRRSPFLGSRATAVDTATTRVLQKSVETLHLRRQGALMVLERNTGLSEYADTGIPLDADIRAPLLEALFVPGSPLHDGAVIIRGKKILAAGCTLPLAATDTSRRLGTRHRAALGITEVSDALAITISEERGTISVALDGRLYAVPTPHDVDTVIRKLTHTDMSRE